MSTMAKPLHSVWQPNDQPTNKK